MTKTFEAKPGDRWTKPPHMEHIYVYRDGVCTRVFPDGKMYHVNAHREPWETDLPTPDAHAQLREWGYVVTGDVAEVKPSSPTILPFGWYSQTISEANWAGPNFATPITESRVREIVAEVVEALVAPQFDKFDDDYDRRCDSLAVRMDNMDHALASLRHFDDVASNEIDKLQRSISAPTPAQVQQAAAIATDPQTKWHDVTEPEVDHDDWRAKCKVWQPPIPGCYQATQFPYAVHSPTGMWCLAAYSNGEVIGWEETSPHYAARDYESESAARAALATAPPPPDVAEPVAEKPVGYCSWCHCRSDGPHDKSCDEREARNAKAHEPDWKGLLERVCDAATIDEQVEALAAARKAIAAKGGE